MVAKMSGTSKKHRNFVSEPMSKKAVTELPGIGLALGNRMVGSGYEKAPLVLGKYLELKQDKQQFQKWMKDSFGANSKQSSDCYQGLNEWCEEFL